MQHRLDDILNRRQELERLLSSPDAAANSKRFSELSREFAQLDPIAKIIEAIRSVQAQIAGNEEMLNESDDELRQMAHDELASLREQQAALEKEFQFALLPKDPNDDRNIILEVRAGTGGEEAALFASDLFRMYSRFAESKRYKVEILSTNETGIGGYREIIAQISGQGAYSQFKFESGVHRVQRVPVTETSGRIHTSAVTVAVLPEADDVEIDVKSDDLRIDVFRASGPGGQSVNTTDSAVRITYLPSGMSVSCQDEKSQHKNKEKALKVLKSRLLDIAQREAHAERAGMRKDMVGSGDRSERIRTYNFPQGRITDHRINLTLYQLDSVLMGAMSELVDALITHHQAELLAAQQG